VMRARFVLIMANPDGHVWNPNVIPATETFSDMFENLR